MEEIWKDIPGYEGKYQVSNMGRVKSLSRIIQGRNQFGSFESGNQQNKKWGEVSVAGMNTLEIDIESFSDVDLSITAGRDSLAEETERLKDTMIRAGVDVVFKRFERAIHGFTIITKEQAKRYPEVYKDSLVAWQMMVDFVNEHI